MIINNIYKLVCKKVFSFFRKALVKFILRFKNNITFDYRYKM